jgi:hypothetical protein
MAALLTPILSAPAACSRETSSTERTPPPTVSGMKTCSAGPDDVVGGRPVVDRGRHVEERDLVGALLVVGAGQLDRVARVAQVEEVHALDHAPGGDVEAGDDPDGEGRVGGRHDQSLAAWIGLTRMARAPRS